MEVELQESDSKSAEDTEARVNQSSIDQLLPVQVTLEQEDILVSDGEKDTSHESEEHEGQDATLNTLKDKMVKSKN